MDGESHRAAAAWAALDSPYEEADALTDTGEEDSLRPAFAIFDQLGARPRALAVARTLRSLGVKNLPHRARSSTRANPGGLTVRELEVAHLLASHLTNDDIASHLYISPKTVDHHVSAVLRKLGVSSRREAARRVRELVPDDAK
jgi:DNA-binding CsgD family transcriptional regulator